MVKSIPNTNAKNQEHKQKTSDLKTSAVLNKNVAVNNQSNVNENTKQTTKEENTKSKISEKSVKIKVPSDQLTSDKEIVTSTAAKSELNNKSKVTIPGGKSATAQTKPESDTDNSKNSTTSKVNKDTAIKKKIDANTKLAQPEREEIGIKLDPANKKSVKEKNVTSKTTATKSMPAKNIAKGKVSVSKITETKSMPADKQDATTKAPPVAKPENKNKGKVAAPIKKSATIEANTVNKAKGAVSKITETKSMSIVKQDAAKKAPPVAKPETKSKGKITAPVKKSETIKVNTVKAKDTVSKIIEAKSMSIVKQDATKKAIPVAEPETKSKGKVTAPIKKSVTLKANTVKAKDIVSKITETESMTTVKQDATKKTTPVAKPETKNKGKFVAPIKKSVTVKANTVNKAKGTVSKITETKSMPLVKQDASKKAPPVTKPETKDKGKVNASDSKVVTMKAIPESDKGIINKKTTTKSSKGTANKKTIDANNKVISVPKSKSTGIKEGPPNKSVVKVKVPESKTMSKKSLPAANQDTPKQTRPVASRGGVGGRGKKFRKPRISPAELRRREIKEWLKVSNTILGHPLCMRPPKMPYFLKREKEFIASRDRKLFERNITRRRREKIRKISLVNSKHAQEVRRRRQRLNATRHKWALNEEQKVNKHITDIVKRREMQDKEHQQRIYQKHMQEIEQLQRRKREELRKRRDDALVTRLLREKFGKLE
jgi:hypothetical protein